MSEPTPGWRARADDLLETARMDTLESLESEPVPPGELARQSARGLQPLADAKSVDVAIEVERGLPTLHADGRLLKRALENILKNAFHYARKRIELRVYDAGSAIRFEVADDGPGFQEHEGRILPEDLGADRSRSDSAGLGLRVAKRVAEAHGGELGIERAGELGGARVWVSVAHA